jgi:hypothetical protein
VPDPESVRKIWLSKIVFYEFGSLFDFLSKEHVHLEIVPGSGRGRITIHR